MKNSYKIFMKTYFTKSRNSEEFSITAAFIALDIDLFRNKSASKEFVLYVLYRNIKHTAKLSFLFIKRNRFI